jgi:MFS family permease
MIWAKLSDIVGRKYIIIVCLCIFTLFSGMCGAAQTIDQLIMFRWCQGVGGGGVFGLVQLIFLELVPRKKLPAYMTMVMSTLALALIVGPLLGGGITLHGSWRWIFLIKSVLHAPPCAAFADLHFKCSRWCPGDGLSMVYITKNSME